MVLIGRFPRNNNNAQPHHHAEQPALFDPLSPTSTQYHDAQSTQYNNIGDSSHLIGDPSMFLDRDALPVTQKAGAADKLCCNVVCGDDGTRAQVRHKSKDEMEVMEVIKKKQSPITCLDFFISLSRRVSVVL